MYFVGFAGRKRYTRIHVVPQLVHVVIYVQEYTQRPVASLKIMPSKLFQVLICLPTYKIYFVVHC